MSGGKIRTRCFPVGRWWLASGVFLLPQLAPAAVTATILAGGETDLPADTPSGRLDTAGEFAFVGSLGAGGWELVGINTFTEGYGGRFGDTGGGVLVEPYADWIVQTTGIPEPGTAALIMVGVVAATWRRGTRRDDGDVLETVKALAVRDRKPLGMVVSTKLRRAAPLL